MQTLIGLKRLGVAKQRLGPDLSPGDRQDLMLAMLASVVAAAHAAGLGPVALATSEERASSIGDALGVAVLSDAGLPWNEGLVHALDMVTPPPEAVLYLAGDLPLATAADLALFVSASPARGVGVARARDGGTNALLVRPPEAIHPRFGEPGSAAVHQSDALAAGVDVAVLDIPGLALDVDTIEDARDAGLVRRPLSGRGRAPGRG